MQLFHSGNAHNTLLKTTDQQTEYSVCHIYCLLYPALPYSMLTVILFVYRRMAAEYSLDLVPML
jgi:hypothetical protein